MTNTLHRYGSAESFYDDYIIFAIPSRGKNDKGSLPKLKQFLEMALPFRPVNLGDAINGGALRPRKDMSPTAHWNRDMTPDFRAVIDGVNSPTTVAAVFDDRVHAEDFVKAVKAADLGLCINISTSIDGAEQCCHEAHQPRHKAEQKKHSRGGLRRGGEGRCHPHVLKERFASNTLQADDYTTLVAIRGEDTLHQVIRIRTEGPPCKSKYIVA